MSVEFKVGDKVRCVRPAAPLLEGGEYIVRSFRDNGEELYVRSAEDEIDVLGSWLVGRFELVVEPEPEAEKPPLGLKPRYIQDRERLIEILEAMLRYANAAKVIPDAWDDEYDDIRERLNDHYDPGQFIHTSV